MSRKHATLAPSSASRWINCPGSPSATKNLPNESGEAASEGTCAHAILEECIKTGQTPQAYRGKKVATYDDDNNVLFEHEVDDDMVYGIGTALYYLGQLRSTGATLHTEVKVELPGVDGEPPDSWGHSDIVGLNSDTITVVDFKYGRSPVSPEGNYQAFLYAIMALRTIVTAPETIQWVRITIVQPRDPSPGPRAKEIILPISDLLAFEAALPAAIAATKEKRPVLRAGSHCRWCPAWGMCSASLSIVDMVAGIMQGSVKEATNPQLAVLFEYRKILEDYLKKGEGELKARLIKGATHPRVKLVTGVKHKQWRGGPELIELAEKALGKSALRLETPATISRLGEKGEAFVASHTTTPPGDPKLAKAGDKRAAYTVQTAETMFAAIPSAPASPAPPPPPPPPPPPGNFTPPPPPGKANA